MKISKTQLEALKTLKWNNLFFMWMGFSPREYYYYGNDHFRVATVKRLIEEGLAEKTETTTWDKHEVSITKKGIKYLEEIE